MLSKWQNQKCSWKKKKRLTDRLGAQEWVSSGCPYSLHSGASAGGQARLEEATTGKEGSPEQGTRVGLAASQPWECCCSKFIS